MGQREAFGRYGGTLGAKLEARRDLLIWLITSLSVSLIPFAIVAIAFRAAHEVQKNHHEFPSPEMLFGGGELLLVILSVTGATLAELWLYPDHFKSLSKLTGIGASLFVALAAGGLFTLIAYQDLTEVQDRLDHSFVMSLSFVFLLLVVVIQAITLLTRPSVQRGTEK